MSRDTSTFPHECVYLLHCPTEEEEEEEEESDEGVGEEGRASGNSGGKMTEIRLVPPDTSQCKFVAWLKYAWSHIQTDYCSLGMRLGVLHLLSKKTVW